MIHNKDSVRAGEMCNGNIQFVVPFADVLKDERCGLYKASSCVKIPGWPWDCARHYQGSEDLFYPPLRFATKYSGQRKLVMTDRKPPKNSMDGYFLAIVSIVMLRGCSYIVRYELGTICNTAIKCLMSSPLLNFALFRVWGDQIRGITLT